MAIIRRRSSLPIFGRFTKVTRPPSIATHASFSAGPSSPLVFGNLIVSAIHRWRKEPGGDPVVELQTTFGGGKTHSMLALYHLASGAPATDLPGMESIIEETGDGPPLSIKRAILVGNQLSPGQSDQKQDGVNVHTLWGEMAYQLGGKPADEKVRQADESGTNPGDAMGTVIRDAAPCLILIDEWVAYARQLMDDRAVSRRRFRDAVHLCPDPQRTGESDSRRSACRQHPGLGSW